MVKELVGLKVRAKEERGKLSSLIKFQFGMGGEGEEEGANFIGWSFSCFRFQSAHKIASLEAIADPGQHLSGVSNCIVQTVLNNCFSDAGGGLLVSPCLGLADV